MVDLPMEFYKAPSFLLPPVASVAFLSRSHFSDRRLFNLRVRRWIRRNFRRRSTSSILGLHRGAPFLLDRPARRHQKMPGVIRTGIALNKKILLTNVASPPLFCHF